MEVQEVQEEEVEVEVEVEEGGLREATPRPPKNDRLHCSTKETETRFHACCQPCESLGRVRVIE